MLRSGGVKLMDRSKISWPDHYPKNCPPDDAESPPERIYRFTNRKSPKVKDFVSYYEQKPNEDWPENKGCMARGLTVYKTLEDSIAAAATVPALKKKHLAVANLPSNSGLIAETPPNNPKNHNTFWPLATAEDLAALFLPINSQVA